MEIGDSRQEWKHLNLFPYAPHLAFWQAHYASLGFRHLLPQHRRREDHGNRRQCAPASQNPTRGASSACLPSSTTSCSTRWRRRSSWPTCSRIVLGGEKVPDGIRRKLKALAARLGSGRVDVIATYGFTEAKMAFPECPYPEDGRAIGLPSLPGLRHRRSDRS